MNEPVIKDLVIEIPISAPKERVWKAILEELPEWWPQDFLCFPESQKIRFEPWPGGRLYEQTEDGRGILWSTVVMIMPGQAIEFAGTVTPTYGGPNITTYRLEVGDADGGSMFKVVNSLFGRMTAEGEESISEGWKYLFVSGLKAYVEANP
jgi:uncharacterized protein YndB with AHSA1/START domain